MPGNKQEDERLISEVVRILGDPEYRQYIGAANRRLGTTRAVDEFFRGFEGMPKEQIQQNVSNWNAGPDWQWMGNFWDWPQGWQGGGGMASRRDIIEALLASAATRQRRNDRLKNTRFVRRDLFGDY